MRTSLLLLSVLSLNTCMCPGLILADEALSEDDKKSPSVLVQCRGQLRHGIMAIGGESTGTTITFHRITWELQFADDDDRELAAQHNKKPVLVTGTLRKVVSTEGITRWIIDVRKISASDSRNAQPDGAQVSVRGTVRAALSTTGDVPDFSIRTEDQTWRLDFAANQEARAAAELLIGQPALLTGTVLPPPDETERDPQKASRSDSHALRVKTIEANKPARTDSRFLE